MLKMARRVSIIYIATLHFTAWLISGLNLDSNTLYIHRSNIDMMEKGSYLNGSYFGASLAFHRQGLTEPIRLLVGSPHDSVKEFALPNLSGKVYSCELEQLISNTSYSSSNPLGASATSSCNVQLSAPREDTNLNASTLDKRILDNPKYVLLEILENNQQLGFSVDSYSAGDYNIAAACGHQLRARYMYSESKYERAFALGNCFSASWHSKKNISNLPARNKRSHDMENKTIQNLNLKIPDYPEKKNVIEVKNDHEQDDGKQNNPKQRRYRRQGTPLRDWSRVSKIWWGYDDLRNDGKYVNKLGYAVIGASVHVTKKGNIVMGAPGLFSAAGGIYLKDSIGECIITTGSEHSRDNHNNYLGYSVTSSPFRTKSGGSIDDDDEIYISGEPRWNYTGRVLVFRVTERVDNTTCKLNISQKLTGSDIQLGSNFGWSVFSEDINGDGMGDLFVGAPLHKQTKGDEGAVFVYMRLSDKQEQSQTQFSENYTVLLGLNVSPGARFGSVIASAGDVNLDGFNDIIIGAPFDDGGKGSVFLYLGGLNGLHEDEKYIQKFTPKNLPSSLRSFGFSISSQSADIDNNAYPDLAVGAFMSELVALVRSRPVHMVTVQIHFSAPLITWPSHHCATSRYPEGMREYDVTVNFFYNIPARQMSSGATLISYNNKYLIQVGQGQASTLTFYDIEKHSLDLSVKRCLAVQWEDVREDCVSFEVTNDKGSYISVNDKDIKLMKYDSLNKAQQEDCSFISRLSKFRNGTFSFESVARRGWYLGVGPEDSMSLFLANQSQDLNENLIFYLKPRKEFQGLEGIVYNISVDTLLTSKGKPPYMKIIHDGRSVSNISGILNFNSSDLYKPISLKWRAVFTDVVRNVLIPPVLPIVYEVKLEQRNNDTDQSEQDSVNSPQLDILHSERFWKQMEFFNPCGEDSICSPNVSVQLFDNSTQVAEFLAEYASNSSSVSEQYSVNPVIVGETKPLSLYAVIQNSGEPADQVELILKYPSELRFKHIFVLNCTKQQIKCQNPSATKNNENKNVSKHDGVSKENETEIQEQEIKEIKCQLTEALFNNSFVIVQANFEAIDETYTPRVDFMTFNADVITRTGLSNQTATAKPFYRPIRYDGKLVISWNSASEYPVGYNTSTLDPVSVNHVYKVISQGQGVNPGVKVLVHIPLCPFPDSSIVESLAVTVKYNGKIIRACGEESAVLKLDSQFIEKEKCNQNAVKLSSSITEKETERNISKEVRLLECPTNDTMLYEFGSMKPNAEAIVNISLTLLTNKIVASSWKDVYVLVESMVGASPAFLNNSYGSIQQNPTDDIYIAYKSMRTIVKPAYSEALPIWAIVLGVGIGLLILLIILKILHKCGFFKRHHAMETYQDIGDLKEVDEEPGADENTDDFEGGSEDTRPQLSLDRSYYDLLEGNDTDYTDITSPAIENDVKTEAVLIQQRYKYNYVE